MPTCEMLVADPAVRWSISPRRTSSRPTCVLAAEHGKHIILEKPMALTLADCDAIIAAVERHKVHLIVGHTHAFDPAVRLMRDIIARGELGKLGLIHSFNYTNFLYRPRRPGRTRHRAGRRHPVQPGAASDRHCAAPGRRLGAQRARQHDDARSFAPDRGKLRRAAAIRRRRRGVAGLQRLRPFRFRRMALRHRERGAPKPIAHGAARRSLAKATDETRSAHRDLRLWRGQRRSAAAPAAFRRHHRHLCRRRHARLGRRPHDLRPRGMRQIQIPRGGSMPGRREVLDDMRMAIRSGQPPVHNGRWAKATVEVALAILQSARDGHDSRTGIIRCRSNEAGQTPARNRVITTMIAICITLALRPHRSSGCIQKPMRFRSARASAIPGKPTR
jgi:phthalate 4,5-cis-dihydrodiol dehydrogenase